MPQVESPTPFPLLRKYGWGLLLILVLLAFTGWWQARRNASRQAEEIKALRIELDAATSARDRAEGKAALLDREHQIASDARTREVEAIEGDQVFEDALSAWIGRVKRLEDYLQAHPEKGLPEMKLLTTNDWLDAAKDGAFETEADLRKALQQLRMLARNKSVPALGKALKEAVAANQGKVPASMAEISSRLPADFDRTILSRFILNPSGERQGLVNRGGVSDFYLLEQPVDEIWDMTAFVSAGGGYGWGGKPGTSDTDVSRAIDAYRQANGQAPSSSSQLEPYLQGRAFDPAQVQKIFTALTTPVAR